MSIGGICVREVDLADANEIVWNAAERMHQRTVGALVIVDDKNHPIGIVTDRDLVVRVLAEQKDPRSTLVREVMTGDLRTIAVGAPVEDALYLMRTTACRRLPVVDESGRLVGIVSLDDVLILLADEFSQVGALLDRETPRAVAST